MKQAFFIWEKAQNEPEGISRAAILPILYGLRCRLAMQLIIIIIVIIKILSSVSHSPWKIIKISKVIPSTEILDRAERGQHIGIVARDLILGAKTSLLLTTKQRRHFVGFGGNTFTGILRPNSQHMVCNGLDLSHISRCPWPDFTQCFETSDGHADLVSCSCQILALE